MSIIDRGIRGNAQSPLNAVSASTVAYGNARMPAAAQGSIAQAVDYLFDAMYPDYKGTVATPAALPASASANDWYLVNDDGDGKSAGYVWMVKSGGGSWVKRYDVDWSYEQILSETVSRTQYMYAAKYGITDKDATGAAITGMYAGQRIYGGDGTLENLTLTANYFDSTGYVQSDNTFRPTVDNAYNLGTMMHRWMKAYFSNAVGIGNTTISDGNINDTSGSFTFSALNVSTTGTLAGASGTFGTMTVGPGSIVDTSAAISFGNNALTTTGAITGASGSIFGDITLTNGTFNTATAAGFSFSSKNVSSVGTLTSSKVVTSEVDVANLILSGQTLATSSSATNLILQAGAGGNTTVVQVQSKLQANFDGAVSGAFSVGGASTLTGAVGIGTALSLATTASVGTISTTAGILALKPFTGILQVTGLIEPEADNTRDLGVSALRFRNLYLGTGIGDGTNSMSMATLMSLRAINTSVADKMILAYNAASSTWLPESTSGVIDHTTLTNLTTGDAGHTQFALLVGRAGGQTLIGGTLASQSLTLQSTSNATQGFILAASDIAPSSDAVYSSGWTGFNLGNASRNFNNMFSKGIHYGLRFDQYAGSGAYPTNSGQNVGRVIWDTTTNQLLIDNGSSWSKVGQQKFQQDLTWDGVMTTQTITISGSISDARTSFWQLLDNTNGYEQVFCKMTKTQTQVTITVSPALPAGTYRLIGLN